jgi:putative tricarboxylic transport membrane protein
MLRIVTALLFLAFAAFYFFYGLRYSFLTPDGRFGAGFFPRIVGTALLGTALLNSISEVRRREPTEANPYWRDIVVVIALIVGFIYALSIVGTIVSIFLFTIVTLAYLNNGGVERWVTNVLVATGLAAFIHFVFRVWLNASVPRGRYSFFGLS